MNACNYLLKGKPDRLLNAKEYGYWSLRWAGGNADQALRTLQAEPFDSMQVIRSARNGPFFLHLQLIALHAACYWVYAAALPHLANTISTAAYTETLRLLKQGLEDGIKDLRQSDGRPYSAELAGIFMNSFKLFHQAVRDDIVGSSEVDPQVVNVNLSRTAAIFIHGTARLYGVDPADLDAASEIVLGHYIDSIPLQVMTPLKDQISIRPDSGF